MRSPSADASDALHARVRRAIEDGLDAAGFDALALDLARFQATHVAPIARLVRARGVDLDRATGAEAIPAVPTDVFRLARVAAHPPEKDVRVFRTSGTTSGARGEHALRTTATYEAAALAWGGPHLFADLRPRRAVVLAPRASDLLESSLSFMIDLFIDHLGIEASFHVDTERGALDVDTLEDACARARAASEPVLLLGTSFAFVWAIDATHADLRLSAGSRAMITGGLKGRTRTVEEPQLRAALADRFALAPGHVIGEYGMTEMSSQLYEPRRVPGAVRPDLYRAPPWVRVVAVDPITLAPVAPGAAGIARIVDLANVDSAVALQTADRVRVTPEGIELLGRLPGATPRGCSLAIEEMREP